MAIKRKRGSSRRDSHSASDNSNSSNSIDPYAASDKPKESLIWRLSKLVEAIFSHKGMFWLGLAIALTFFICNIWLYNRLLFDRADMVGWQAFIVALFISSFTTLFEVMPVVWRRSRRNVLNRIFAAGAKPHQLPNLRRSIVGDADELLKVYRNGDKDTQNFFDTMRWIAISIEILIGVIFMGSIGTGVRAFFSLALFIASIFGVEWGVSLMVRAAEWELPAQIREQLNDLIANAGQKLNLRNLD